MSFIPIYWVFEISEFLNALYLEVSLNYYYWLEPSHRANKLDAICYFINYFRIKSNATYSAELKLFISKYMMQLLIAKAIIKLLNLWLIVSI